MIYSAKNIEENMSSDQLLTLQLIRGASQASGPAGYPGMLPMWRVESGTEGDATERSEVVATRQAMAKLHETEEAIHRTLCRLVAGKALKGSEDVLMALAGLDLVDALIGEIFA